MNLASMVADLLQAESPARGPLLILRVFAPGEEVPPIDLDRAKADRVRYIDLTGRRADPMDPEQLAAVTAAANAATVAGMLAPLLEALPAEPEAPHDRALDCFRYVDLQRERQRRGLRAVTIKDSQVLP